MRFLVHKTTMELKHDDFIRAISRKIQNFKNMKVTILEDTSFNPRKNQQYTP